MIEDTLPRVLNYANETKIGIFISTNEDQDLTHLAMTLGDKFSS